MAYEHIVPSIKDLVFKGYAEGLASKTESYIEQKKW